MTATPQGLRFSVPDGLRGMKWSHLLREALAGTRYAVMRYRAHNLRGWGEYVLYAASTGPAPVEAYVIGHGELTDDGQWHVHVSPVSLTNVGIIAIQVQAAQNDAFLEVAELRLTDRKPVVRLADTFEATPGWPTQMDNWRPVALPPGNLPGEKIADLLTSKGGSVPAISRLAEYQCR